MPLIKRKNSLPEIPPPPQPTMSPAEKQVLEAAKKLIDIRRQRREFFDKNHAGVTTNADKVAFEGSMKRFNKSVEIATEMLAYRTETMLGMEPGETALFETLF